MDWILASIIGTSVVVLVLCVIKIISMKGEVEWLIKQVGNLNRDRGSFGWHKEDTNEFYILQDRINDIWRRLRDKVIYEIQAETRAGRKFTLQGLSLTQGFAVNKVLDELLSSLDFEIEEVSQKKTFAIKKVKKN